LPNKDICRLNQIEPIEEKKKQLEKMKKFYKQTVPRKTNNIMGDNSKSNFSQDWK